jgi:hypothetical protein
MRKCDAQPAQLHQNIPTFHEVGSLFIAGVQCNACITATLKR